jgi:hypothetical protein
MRTVRLTGPASGDLVDEMSAGLGMRARARMMGTRRR